MKIDARVFESLVETYQQRVNAALDYWLPPANVNPMRLHRAMRYAVLAPGKRVRPILVYATAAALGIELERVDGAAQIVDGAREHGRLRVADHLRAAAAQVEAGFSIPIADGDGVRGRAGKIGIVLRDGRDIDLRDVARDLSTRSIVIGVGHGNPKEKAGPGRRGVDRGVVGRPLGIRPRRQPSN